MPRPSIGLLGRILAILMLTLTIEFVASTLLYERASVFSVRDDEAHRLAEHLAITRHLIGEYPLDRRAAIATQLTTDRYEIRWTIGAPTIPPISPTLENMRDQIIAWEPDLADADLRLRARLIAPGTASIITGELRLVDGSWIRFRTREPMRTIDLAIGRIVLALIPSIALLLLGGLLVRRTLRPLRQLADAADRIGRSDPEPVVEAGPQEVRRVTRAFNRMQGRIVRLIDERTRALAAVGHDLRTPLARLQLRADAIDDATARDKMHGDLIEMEAMVESLMAFLGGESDSERPVLTDLAILCATLADDAQDRGRDATYVGPDHFDHVLRPFGFKRALVNLVENALHHGDGITITLEIRDDAVVVAIEDDGPGIPPDALESVMEPFVRLDGARRRDTIGFGLGLPIVQRAVEAERGRLTLTNRPEKGLRAEIRLSRG